MYFKNMDLFCFCSNLSAHKFMICSLSFCALCGVCMGCISGSDELSFAYYMADIKIFGVIFQEESVVSIFWSRIGLIFASSVIIFVCSLNRFCLPLSFLFITFRGFMLGSNLLCAMLSYGLNGLIIVIFLSLPVNIILICMQLGMCTYGHRFACLEVRKWSILYQSTGTFFCMQMFVCVIETVMIQVLVLPLIFIL